MNRMTFSAMTRVTGRWFALMALAVALPALAAPQFEVGERVFIPLFAKNLKDDGYAQGRILKIHGAKADVVITKLVNGADKTMYGTCSPGGGSSPLSNDSVADKSGKPVNKDVPLDKIMKWQKGTHTYLERENLSTAIQKWLGDGMAITPNRLDVAERRAVKLGLPRVQEAVKLARLQVKSTGGHGFPVPAEMALKGSAQMLDAVAKRLAHYPDAVSAAAAKMAGTAPGKNEDLLTDVIIKIAHLTEHQLQSLQNEHSDPRDVSGFSPAQLEAIYTGWYRMMTANDTQPYLNAKLAYYKQQVKKQIQSGKWPTLD